MLYITTKFWGMGQHHVFGWWEHYRSTRATYQLWSNTWSFQLISLSSWSSQRYHEASTAPPSSSITPTKNLRLHYINGRLQFGRVNKWGMHVAALAFTPLPYIPEQIITSTPIYTMEVSSFFGRIEKFSKRPNTISLRELKATFSIVVCEFKYGANYIEAFAFKQLTCYV